MTQVSGEHRVVVNHDGQYSLLPATIANPPGWRDAGMSGTVEVCLRFIREHWTDMRPLSMRTAPLPLLLALLAP